MAPACLIFHYKFSPQVYHFTKSQIFDYVEGIQRLFSLLFYIFLVEIIECHIGLKLRRLTVYLSNLYLSSIDKNKLPKSLFWL